MKLNIIIVGVGGQGALTTAGILARAAMRSGLNVITAETHGMAQRGGSVEVHVRIGNVRAPLIPIGAADIMIALEPSEALRYAKYLNPQTTIILNTRKIIPPSVTTGISTYPSLEKIIRTLKSITDKIFAVNASEIAEEAGNILTSNVVVLGILLGITDIPVDYTGIEETIKEVMPAPVVDVNLKALKLGYDYSKSIRPSVV